ncbi:FtsX-like permease family protein [Kribbella sp. NPDC051952]|uniref:FtsX-like permease family protein n=1 Tax=Kribbella sp. NPDC051952 TaxID=3154851 RepID=UPI00341C9E63
MAGLFLRQALRYRWSQALVLAGISLLIGTCAVFAPWFARAVQQTVMTETLQGQRLSAAWQLESSPARISTGKATQPEDLSPLLPADLKPLFTPSVLGIQSDVNWRESVEPIVSRLMWRDGYCAQLEVVAGRCPTGPNEVISSTVDEKTWQVKLGTKIPVSAVPGKDETLTVVGMYRAKDSEADYWFGRPPVGHSHPPVEKAPGETDYLFTDRTTFTPDNWGQHATLDTRPIPGVARLDDLDRIEAASNTVKIKAIELGTENSTGLTGVIDRIRHERSQAATIIPLVMVQVALFGLVVLALALAVVVDQRRPEIAVARLRGSTARRTGRSLSVELGVPVLLGTLIGGPVGFALLLIVRATWLQKGAPIELPWTVPVALLVVVLVALGVVVVQVRGVVRQQISALLRRVPLRRGRTIGIVDLIIIVISVTGLVSALTSSGQGPLPVLAPALLALAVGLTFAHVLLPIAGLISRRALRRGRLGLALGTLQISRRPAVTRIVAAVAVAAGLVAFAGQASSVGEYNRESRAGYEAGAEGVLRLNAGSLGNFMAAVNKVDPDRQWSTPVVATRPPSPDALQTMLIEPDSFRRVAFRGDELTDAEGFAKLAAPKVAPIEFHTSQLTLTASTSPMTPVPQKKSPYGEEPKPQEPAHSLLVIANVVNLRTGARNDVTFPKLPLTPGKPTELHAKIDCKDGCQLLRIGIGRELTDQSWIQGDVRIDKLSSDDHPSVALGNPEDWQSVKQGDTGDDSIDAASGGALTMTVKNLGGDQLLQYATVPAVVPALVTPDYRYTPSATAPALDGAPMVLNKVDRLDGPVNRFTLRTAVVDLETGRRLAGTVDDTSTEFELWLNAAGLAKVDQITDQLRATGLAPNVIDRRTDRIASYGRSASALALQLTPVVGIAGWALAIVVLLLTVVTSWRSRAQDYASLRITGVPAATTGRAARWEQTGPVAFAVLLGSICGVVGAQIALPLIPLFADAGGPIPLELDTNWPVAIVLWIAGTAVLTAVTLLLGTGVNRRAGFARIREELT